MKEIDAMDHGDTHGPQPPPDGQEPPAPALPAERGTVAVVVVTPVDGEWHVVSDPAVIDVHLDKLVRQDGQGHRMAPFMAAGTGAISIIEVPPGLSVPDEALGVWRALAWLHDGDGGGPVAFPDADELLAWAGRVLITDQTRASELVYVLAGGMAASSGRAVLVETAPARRCCIDDRADGAPGRVVRRPAPPLWDVPSSAAAAGPPLRG
jgi:hypothetical protein